LPTDNSTEALAYAADNVRKHYLAERIRLFETDLWEGLEAEKFDAVVSNPPYLTQKDLSELQPEVSFEPRRALDGTKDGLEFYRRITRRVKDILKPGGTLFFEVGIGQAKAVSKLMREHQFLEIEIAKDYNGIDRIVSARS